MMHGPTNIKYVQDVCSTPGPPGCVMRPAGTGVNNACIVKLHNNFGGYVYCLL